MEIERALRPLAMLALRANGKKVSAQTFNSASNARVYGHTR